MTSRPTGSPSCICAQFAARVLVALIGFCAGNASAADLRVFCPTALREPVLELTRSFARASGQRVEFVFASVGAVHKRIASGERADLAVGTSEGVEALVRLGPGVDGSQAVIARSALALATLPGRLAPSVAGAQAVARALLSARSIAAPDARAGVPGGAQVAELLKELQLTEALQPRMRWLFDAREAGKRVASGDVELAVAAMNDVVGVAGVEVVGPITEPMTHATVYAAVITRSAANPEGARAFIVHLRAPEAASVFRRAGYVAAE